MADKPDPGGVTVVVGGDGDGDGSSSSGGGSSSSSAPADPTGPFRNVLRGLRLPPGLFADLMARAAQENWGANDFLWALSVSKQFNRMFPGIQSLLDEGMSVQQAIATWRGTTEAYEQSLRDAGLWGFIKQKMSKQNMGLAIKNGIDPEEMVFRVSIAEQAKRSEPLRMAFNAILKGRQEAQLDKRGWLKFLLGKSDARLYDMYEGAQLLQTLGGVDGLRVKDARMLAKSLGQPGQFVDVTDAVGNINRLRRTIGTEVLRGAGLDTADLALAALSESLTGRTPKRKAKAEGIISRLEQLSANAEAAAKAGDMTGTGMVNGRPISATAPQ